MKKIKKLSQILFGSIIGLISCVGDKTDPINVAEVVGISGNVGGSLQSMAFKIDTLVEVKYKVSYESVNSLTKDLPITIGVTQSALDLLKATNIKRATTGDDASPKAGVFWRTARQYTGQYAAAKYADCDLDQFLA